MKKKLPPTPSISATLMTRLSLWTFALGMTAITLFGFHYAWKFHMMVDGYFAFYDRAEYFLKHGNLTNVPFNEYQPGAIFYFVFLSPVLLLDNTRDTFLLALVMSNILLLLGYAWWLYKSVHPVAVFILGLLLWCGGPLILYRFELYCHLIVLAGVMLNYQGKRGWGEYFLGLATAIKVYPVLLLPLFLRSALLTKKPVEVAARLTGFGLGILTVVIAYVNVFQVPFADVWKNVIVHSDKPVHIESLSGSLTTLVTYISGEQPGLHSYLIHGVATRELLVPKWIYTYLWLLPLGVVYGWLFYRQRRLPQPLLLEYVGVLAVFLAFASQMGPQYIYWYALFLPLLGQQVWENPQRYGRMFFWLCFTLVVTQAVFPLYYSDLLNFYADKQRLTPFYLLLIRNLGVALTTYQLLKLLWLQPSPKR
ncbi:MAG TPA: hypothetical protein VD999_00210 [Vitreimonas sp.]|nr:hypothetical protein [Vitreimonas sp.]